MRGITSVLWRYSVLWRVPSVLWGPSSVLWKLFSTVGDKISTVGDKISTVGDSFTTVEGIQYIGGYHQYSEGTFSTVGITSVLWRLLSTVEIRLEILRIFKLSLNLVQKLISLRNQINHVAGLKC